VRVLCHRLGGRQCDAIRHGRTDSNLGIQQAGRCYHTEPECLTLGHPFHESSSKAGFRSKDIPSQSRGRKNPRRVAEASNSLLSGDPADAVFYIQMIELKVSSQQGKEAILAILGVGDFFGEGCLVGQPLRMVTAVTATECSVMRLEKSAMIAVLRDEPVFSALFISFLLTRNIRIEDDLVDQLSIRAKNAWDGKPEAVIPKVSQETLAEMIGTTRSRVSFFMNKFRKLGFVEYNGGLSVHSSLLNVVLHA
jgi:CRP/FNR family cyclic AMP-dependent transcriptional regulator